MNFPEINFLVEPSVRENKFFNRLEKCYLIKLVSSPIENILTHKKINHVGAGVVETNNNILSDNFKDFEFSKIYFKKRNACAITLHRNSLFFYLILKDGGELVSPILKLSKYNGVYQTKVSEEAWSSFYEQFSQAKKMWKEMLEKYIEDKKVLESWLKKPTYKVTL